MNTELREPRELLGIIRVDWAKNGEFRLNQRLTRSTPRSESEGMNVVAFGMGPTALIST